MTALRTLSAVALAGLAWAAPSAAQDTRAEWADDRLIVSSWPPVGITVDSTLTYVGSRSFRLYDVADAEIHVFLDAGPDSVVDRLYWLQLEEVLPESDHRYDYSELPRTLEIGGLPFVADARYGAGYSLETVDPEGDVAEVIRVLADAGFRMPSEMMRLRMVTLDDERRRELLVIYLEDLASRDLSLGVLEAAGEAAWDRLADRLQERARGGIEIRPTGDAPGAAAPGAPSPDPGDGSGGSSLEEVAVRGFAFELSLTLDAPPGEVWEAITGDLSGWWDHNFSGDPVRFVLEPWPGGRFLEVFEEGSRDGVLHGTVTFAQRPRMLRFEGPLGLAGYAVHGVYTYTLEPEGGGTHLTLAARMTGEVKEGWPETVQRVWRHFLFDGLKPFLER